MDFCADMMGDEAHNAFAVGRRKPLPGIGQALSQPVDPKMTVGIEHHLHNGRVFEPCRDGGPKRGPQHPRAATNGFRPE